MNKWVNEWMNKWVNEWMSESMIVWVNESVSERMSEWMSQRVSEWVSQYCKWVSEWVVGKNLLGFHLLSRPVSLFASLKHLHLFLWQQQWQETYTETSPTPDTLLHQHLQHNHNHNRKRVKICFGPLSFLLHSFDNTIHTVISRRSQFGHCKVYWFSARLSLESKWQSCWKARIDTCLMTGHTCATAIVNDNRAKKALNDNRAHVLIMAKLTFAHSHQWQNWSGNQ